MAGSSRTRLKVACRKAVIRRTKGREISRASSPTGHGVRRAKAALYQWVRDLPGYIAPAGSNWSSHGGNEVAEASDVKDRYRRFRECTGRNVSEH